MPLSQFVREVDLTVTIALVSDHPDDPYDPLTRSALKRILLICAQDVGESVDNVLSYI